MGKFRWKKSVMDVVPSAFLQDTCTDAGASVIFDPSVCRMREQAASALPTSPAQVVVDNTAKPDN